MDRVTHLLPRIVLSYLGAVDLFVLCHLIVCRLIYLLLPMNSVRVDLYL